VKRENYSTAEILDGIKNGDNKVLHFIYEEYFKSIFKMVQLKGGSGELAQDIFQEALVLVYKKLRAGELSSIESSFFTYFYSVARITMYYHFQNLPKYILHHSNTILESDAIDNSMWEDKKYVLDGIKEALFHKYLRQLSRNCFNIIKWLLAGVKAKDVMIKLGFASELVVRKKKLECLDELVKLIKKDPNSKHVL